MFSHNIKQKYNTNIDDLRAPDFGVRRNLATQPLSSPINKLDENNNSPEYYFIQSLKNPNKLKQEYNNLIKNINFNEIPGISDTIVNMASAIAIQTELSVIPGFGEVLMVAMVFNMIDPYDYNNTFTQDTLQSISGQLITNISASLKQVISDPNFLNNIYTQLSNAGLPVTQDQIQTVLNKIAAFWSVAPSPQVQTSCYGDYPKGLSGTPVAGGNCNPVYQGAYQDFYSQNRDDYVNKLYEAGKILYRAIISYNLNTYRSQVLRTFKYIVIFIFFLVFIFFLLKFLLRKKH
jgi:hypothetical protein